jgi:hypothetical protein
MRDLAWHFLINENYHLLTHPRDLAFTFKKNKFNFEKPKVFHHTLTFQKIKHANIFTWEIAAQQSAPTMLPPILSVIA